MSPEQCNPDFGEVTPQSDIYSLGIMTYELLTGKLPFEGANKVVMCSKHLNEPLPQNPHLPHSLYRVLTKATAKHPSERYATVNDYVRDLQGWQNDPANLDPVILSYVETLEKRLRDQILDRFVELSGVEQILREKLEQKVDSNFDPLAGFSDYDDFFHTISAPVEADHVKVEATDSEYVSNVREYVMNLDKIRVVLVGEPGSGKTWMIFRLALAFAAAFRQHLQDRIPVLVPLNLYKAQQTFDEFVRERAGALGMHLDALIRQDKIILLCDALNEMPKTHVETVKSYLQKIQTFVVTCRVRDYKDELNTPELNPLEQIVLRDMDLDAIREFVVRRLGEKQGQDLWRVMGGSEQLIEIWRGLRDSIKVEDFWNYQARGSINLSGEQLRIWETMHVGKRLLPLARNPFTAQMICGIFEREGNLPNNRAALFKSFVINLLEREEKNAKRQNIDFPSISIIEDMLVQLAQLLQIQKTTTVAASEVQASLRVEDVDALVKAATDANILVSEGGEIKFTHQLLQEYFAAHVLLEAMNRKNSPSDFWDGNWWETSTWRETTVILGELLGNGAKGANAVARWLAPVSPEFALQVILRNGSDLSIEDVEVETQDALIASAQEKIAEIDPSGRSAAYRVLGIFAADKRDGVITSNKLIPEVEWVAITASDNMPTFLMSRYLITYSQFQLFIEASDGFHNPTWWSDLPQESTTLSLPPKPNLIYWNHPRDRISWSDAIAFCRWFSYKSSFAVSLPSEQQWALAAKMTEANSTRNVVNTSSGNYRETGIGQTSAVGIFAEDTSADSICDLYGNTWEWCLNKYINRESVEIGSSDLRVVKGGSYQYSHELASVEYTDSLHPTTRRLGVSFRIVRGG